MVGVAIVVILSTLPLTASNLIAKMRRFVTEEILILSMFSDKWRPRAAVALLLYATIVI